MALSGPYKESIKAGTTVSADAVRAAAAVGFLVVDDKPRSVTSVIKIRVIRAVTSPLPESLCFKPLTLQNRTLLKSRLRR